MVRQTWFTKMLRAIGVIGVEPDGKVQHSAGADFVPDMGFRGSYDPKASLSALAAFPWPFACVQAISSDLSKLPIKVYRGRGSEAEQLDDHPILRLLEQPSSRVGSTLFRRQLYTDLVLTGNAFTLIAGINEPQALLRLHPSRMLVVPLEDGQPSEYEYISGGGQPARYSYEQIMHVRAPSWSDDPTSLWGTGCVQPLHHDLTTEKAQADLTARTAATGQPTGILSPKEEGDRWSKEQIRTLREAYEHQMQSGGSGVLILGGQAQFDKMSFTPREMEFSEVRDFVRASTLAAFDVPPARVGLPNTNYATALAQSKRYWEGLQGRAALVDAELTKLARMFGDDDIMVRHDFSGVDSLQESRSERLRRVTEWNMLGVPLAEASAYEGFDDVPFLDDDEDGATVAASTDAPLAATALNGAQIASLLTILSSVAAGAISSDAALVLIGVSFPTIDAEQAKRIVAGALAVPGEDEEQPETVNENIERLVAGFGVAKAPAKYDDINFSVPNGVKDELAKGLSWHEDGHSGDGLTPATVSWARRMVGGQDISPEKARKMRAWLARHEADKSGEGYKPGEPGFPSPGRVAWALWGGDSAISWSNKLVNQMDKADQRKAVITGTQWLTVPDQKQLQSVWRNFISKAQEPAEKELQLAMLRYLRAYAARIAKRLPDIVAQKAAGGQGLVLKAPDTWLTDLVDAFNERGRLSRAIRGVLLTAWKRAISVAAGDMQGILPGDFEYDPKRINMQVDQQLGALIKNVEPATRDAVGKIVRDGLAEGATISDMQKALMDPNKTGFNAARARRIARTEATKSTNAGGVAAWEKQAADAGMTLDLTWEAAPDARDAHAELHGTDRGPDGVWEYDGATAEYPGGFGVGELDINCRCTYTPKVTT